jgi:hypothetical protein
LVALPFAASSILPTISVLLLYFILLLLSRLIILV